MNLKSFAFLFVLLLLVVACGGEGEQPTPATQADATADMVTGPPPEVVALLEQHCSGFKKYKESLSFKGAYSMYYSPLASSGLPTDTEVLWLEYFIPENDSRIPGKFRANGYTLLAGVEKTTGALVLKGIAASVFLDAPEVGTSKDVVIPVK